MSSTINKENAILMLIKHGKTISTMANIDRLIEMSNTINYTGKAWKHHVSSDFTDEATNCDNGAGKGGTIFLDYDKMIEYLNSDGRKWHVAELNLKSCPIRYDFGNKYMATIMQDWLCENGFVPLGNAIQVVSNTIQHDYQYKGLMYVSIAESIQFNNELIGNGMRIIALSDMEFMYIQAAKKGEMIHHTPPKRGTIGKVLDLFINIFNKTKGLI